MFSVTSVKRILYIPDPCLFDDRQLGQADVPAAGGELLEIFNITHLPLSSKKG